MMVTPADAAPHPVHHAMDGGGECFEALFSPTGLAEKLNLSISLPEPPLSECLGGQPVKPAPATFQSDPLAKGPLRYILLLTFLI